MAIAPLMEYQALPDGSCGLLERPWPRAVLQVVPSSSPGRAGAGEGKAVRAPAAVALRPMSPSESRACGAPRVVRRSAAARRRSLLLAALVAGLITVLALPLGALGGAPAPAPAPGHGAVATSATVYVVQPGDTLWSIASRFDRTGNPRSLAEAIARETGSAAVVPGERIAIP